MKPRKPKKPKKPQEKENTQQNKVADKDKVYKVVIVEAEAEILKERMERKRM